MLEADSARARARDQTLLNLMTENIHSPANEFLLPGCGWIGGNPEVIESMRSGSETGLHALKGAGSLRHPTHTTQKATETSSEILVMAAAAGRTAAACTG